MKDLLRQLLPQWIINNFYHLPRACLANISYGSPTRGLKVIGVTGTDGKTTTVNMIYQILKDAGKKVSMVSTINAPGFHVTSPDPFIIQKFARQAVDHGDEYMVLEVTSHALDQFRFWGIKFEIGVITNITHEHLDYHKTFENYKKTKLKLLYNAKYAVVNKNIGKIRGVGEVRVVTFGESSIRLKIPGAYNIANAKAALAVANVLGINHDVARKSVENFKGVVGRMEEVKNKKGVKIVIDFAHTPNGLKQSLIVLRSQASPGRLIALIGCEGYRDVGKRSMMGEISGRLADVTVITSVDPRGQLEEINKQIIQGILKAGFKREKNFFISEGRKLCFIIPDRQKAIDFAVNNLAKKGDTVGIFGKGHEKSMNLDGKKEISWSDKDAVKKVLKGDQRD